jgi:hypothetical protein
VDFKNANLLNTSKHPFLIVREIKHKKLIKMNNGFKYLIEAWKKTDSTARTIAFS